jgi:diaminopimelate decarboxylase
MRTADCGDARAATGLRTALAAAARDYGTPVYVLDMAAVARAAAEVETAFGGPWLRHYSLKANDLPAVTRFLLGRGWAASVVSTGEWQHARSGGAASDGLAFEGIGKTDWQLDCAVRESAAGTPLRWLSAESADEIAQLRLLADRYGLGGRGPAPVDLLVRLNPQVQPETRAELAVGAAASKFGMSREEIAGLAVRGQLDGGGLRLRGVHVHVGSDLRDVRAWAQAGVRAAALLADLARVVPGGTLDTICFGGGFPVGPAAPAPAQFRGALEAALAEAGLALPARPAIEPGRFLVGPAGWLVSSVLHVRQDRPAAQQVVLDAGMTELIRPALYGSHHRVHAIATRSACGAAAFPTLLEGPLCESTDSLGTHQLPPLRRGDLVAIQDAGAYAASFTSRYNGRPQPAEVLLWPGGSLQRCDRPRLELRREASPDEILC